VLERSGELKRLGFDCKACQSDPFTQASRGCGVRPVVDDPYHGEVEIDLLALLGRMPADATVDEVKRACTSAWLLADIGHAIDITGSPWPWCPAWFARFHRGPELVEVDRAIRGANWARRGAPWVVYGMQSAALTPRETRLLKIAWDALDHLRADAERRAYEKGQGGDKQ